MWHISGVHCWNRPLWSCLDASASLRLECSVAITSGLSIKSCALLPVQDYNDRQLHLHSMYIYMYK